MTIQIPDLGIEQRIEKFKLIKELDENRIEQNLEGNVVFHSADYEVLRQETLQGKGIQSALAIEMCGEDEIQIDCNIGHNQGKFSLTNCTYEKKVFIKDPLDCLKDLEVNIFDYQTKTIQSIQGSVLQEVYEKTKRIKLSDYGQSGTPSLQFCLSILGVVPDNGVGWYDTYVKVKAVPYLDTDGEYQLSMYVIYNMVRSAVQYSSEWIELPGTAFYYFQIPESIWLPPVYTSEVLSQIEYVTAVYEKGKINYLINKNISNTIDIKDVIEAIFTCSGLPLVSNFLGINSDNTQPNNEVYEFALDKMQNLRIAQSYDIIREKALQDSFGISGKLKAKKFIESFTKWLNLVIFHDTITDDLRIEHVSYLNAKGIDFVDQNIAYLLDENIEVNKDIIQSETWRMAAITPNGYETIITYDVVGESQPKEYQIELILTDLIGTINNKEFEQTEYQKLFYILQTDGVSVLGLNTQLNINEVIKRLHYSNRVLPKGIHDGMNVDFSGYSLGLSTKLEYNGSLKDFRKLNPANSLVTRSGTFMIKKMEFSDSKIEFEIVK